jgi:hypothetical protein
MGWLRCFLDKAFAPELLSNWFLTGFAFVGAIFAYRSWCALMKQVTANERAAEAAERTLFLTERADILLDRIEIPDPSSVPNSKVILILRNFGRTRADKFHYNFGYGLPGGTATPPENPSTILGAGAEIKLWTRCTILETVGQKLFTQIWNGEAQYKVWGDATYNDVFNQPHHLRFSASFRPPWSFDIDENDAN